jgi:hypothetical protein
MFIRVYEYQQIIINDIKPAGAAVDRRGFVVDG